MRAAALAVDRALAGYWARALAGYRARAFAVYRSFAGSTASEGDGLGCAVGHVVGHCEGQAGVGEHLLALLDVGAFGAQHDGQREAELLHGADDPLGEPIDAQD